MPMKVPGSCPLTEPQERSAEPKVEEKNSAKEARGLRYAEAARGAGHSWRCGSLGSVRWFTAYQTTISRENIATSNFLASRNVSISICRGSSSPDTNENEMRKVSIGAADLKGSAETVDEVIKFRGRLTSLLE